MFTGNPGPSFLIPTSWMILNTTFNHLWFLSKGNRRVGLGSPLSVFSSWGKNYVWSPLLFLYCLSHTKQESKHEYTFVNIELRSFPANGNQYIEAHNGFLIGRYLQSPQHCQILLSLPQDHSRNLVFLFLFTLQCSFPGTCYIDDLLGLEGRLGFFKA